MITRVIGIDFGTSTTVVRILNYGEKKIGSLQILNFDGHPYVPTVIFKQEGSCDMSFGYEAENQLKENSKGDFISNFKIDLISSDEKVRKTAEGYAKSFIGYLYKIYSQCNVAGDFGHCDKTKTYISYPAKWPSSVRDVMKRCAIEAGFGNEESVKGMDEPTAAVLACINENEQKLKAKGLFFENTKYKTLMIDMGAGTTDLVLFNYEIVNGKIALSNLITYPTVDNDSLCGGREIDKILYEYLVSYASKIPKSGKIQPGVLRRFSGAVKSWKEIIVSKLLLKNQPVEAPVSLTDMKEDLISYGLPVNEVAPFNIDRHGFEQLTSIHWKEWHELIQEIFMDETAKGLGYRNPDDIDLIILTGGHSQWYGVRDFLLGKSFAGLQPIKFGKINTDPERLIQSVHPQETVAAGLCYVDKNIVAAVPLANNVWVQFKYDGKVSNVIKLAEKGTTLPFTKNDISIKDKIKGNFVFTKSLSCTYTIICGASLGTGKKFIKTIIWPVDTDILRLIFSGAAAFIFYGFTVSWQIVRYLLTGESLDKDLMEKITECDYDFEINPKIEINEEGIAVVSGIMKFAGNGKDIPQTII